MRELYRATWIATIILIPTLACLPDCLAAQDLNSTQNQKSSLSLTIRAVEGSMKLGSPVNVDVSLANISDHVIGVYTENTKDQGGFVYKAYVWDEKASLLPETKFARRARGDSAADEAAQQQHSVMLRSGAQVPLEPGKTITDRVDVSKLCDLSVPGKYTIQIERFDLEVKAAVKSNKITVAVTP